MLDFGVNVFYTRTHDEAMCVVFFAFTCACVTTQAQHMSFTCLADVVVVSVVVVVSCVM